MISLRRIVTLGGWVVAVAAIPLLAAGRAETRDVSTALIDEGHGKYHIEGHFHVDAGSQIAWGVLTDYDHISQFVSSLVRSQIQERRPGRLLLEQEGTGGVFIFSKRVRVLLAISEEPYRTISFEDVSHQDFKSYKGTWQLLEDHGGMEVDYKLDAERKFSVPNFIAKAALKKGVAELLHDVQLEILRRARSI